MAQNTRVVFYREKSGRVPMQRWIDRLPVLDESLKLEIAAHIYELRESTGKTQREFSEFVGVEPSVLNDLEEWDYEGDSLAMLAHIEKALARA